MSDVITIILQLLAFVAVVCVVQLILLALAHSNRCPRVVRVILTFLLLLPATAFLVLIPITLLSKPGGFIDLRGLVAILCLIAALVILAGWGLGFGVRALYRRKKGGAA